MNKIIFALFILTTQSLFSQNKLSETDSLNILFKAKMLTMITSGISDSQRIISNTTRQHAEYILNDTFSDEFNLTQYLFIKIYFNQAYLFETENVNHSLGTFNNCCYIIGYSIEKAKFYRLFGFKNDDYKIMKHDLKSDFCGYMLKKLKQEIKNIPICNEEIITEIVVY